MSVDAYAFGVSLQELFEKVSPSQVVLEGEAVDIDLSKLLTWINAGLVEDVARNRTTVQDYKKQNFPHGAQPEQLALAARYLQYIFGQEDKDKLELKEGLKGFKRISNYFS